MIGLGGLRAFRLFLLVANFLLYIVFHVCLYVVQSRKGLKLSSFELIALEETLLLLICKSCYVMDLSFLCTM